MNYTAAKWSARKSVLCAIFVAWASRQYDQRTRWPPSSWNGPAGTGGSMEGSGIQAMTEASLRAIDIDRA